MHLKVFVKLKKTLKTLSSGQKNPKNPKKPKKTKKKQKNPLGWVFKKTGFFSNPASLCLQGHFLQGLFLFRTFGFPLLI
jgi:hypothetical protein